MTENEFQAANRRLLERRKREAIQAPQPLAEIIPGVIENVVLRTRRKA